MMSRRAVRAFVQARSYFTTRIARGGGGHHNDSKLHFEAGPTTDHLGRLGNIPVSRICKLELLIIISLDKN